MLQTLFDKDYSENDNEKSGKNQWSMIWKRCNALKVRKFQKKIILIKKHEKLSLISILASKK